MMPWFLSSRHHAFLPCACLVFACLSAIAWSSDAPAASHHGQGEDISAAHHERNIEEQRGNIALSAQRRITLLHEQRTVIDNGILRYRPDNALDQGAIFFDGITFSGQDLLDDLMALRFCIAGHDRDAVSLSSRGLIFQGSRQLLPHGHPVETMSIARVSSMVSPTGECLAVSAFQAEDILHQTGRGARLEIDRLSFTAQASEGRPALFSIEGLSLRHENGLPLLTIAALEFTTGDFRQLLDQIVLLFDAARGSAKGNLPAILEGQALDLRVSGLFFYPKRILADEGGDLFVAGPDDPVSGTLSASINPAGHQITAAFAADLTTLVDVDFSLILQGPDPQDSWKTSRLVSMSLAFQDRGILRFSGISPTLSVADLIRRFLPSRARSLTEPLLAHFDHDAGSFTLALQPENPVSLPEIMLMAITNPEGVGDFLGIVLEKENLER